MPLNVEISRDKICRIRAFKAKGLKVSEICQKTGRSRAAVYKVLSETYTLNSKKRSGRPRKTTERLDRKVMRFVSSQKLSLREVSQRVDGVVSKDTVHRRIKESKNIVYRHMRRIPLLKKEHKEQRLAWAKDHMHWKDEWMQVIFSDEKKFNLDGPDGWNSYWHDLRREPRTLFSRQKGGGSLMVWGAFSFNGTTDIAFLEGKQTSIDYVEVLNSHLLPIAETLGGPNYVYQQDNAPIHTSKLTKKWFADNNVNVMVWPARSPDLNPVENLWGILVRSVYASGRQFSNVLELRKEIERSWFDIKPDCLQSLVQSMPGRIFAVINKNGSIIGR